MTDTLQSLPVHCSQSGTTLWIPLPRHLWRACGPCNCPTCNGADGYWDTLAIAAHPTPGTIGSTWTVHFPELHR